MNLMWEYGAAFFQLLAFCVLEFVGFGANAVHFVPEGRVLGLPVSVAGCPCGAHSSRPLLFYAYFVGCLQHMGSSAPGVLVAADGRWSVISHSVAIARCCNLLRQLRHLCIHLISCLWLYYVLLSWMCWILYICIFRYVLSSPGFVVAPPMRSSCYIDIVMLKCVLQAKEAYDAAGSAAEDAQKRASDAAGAAQDKASELTGAAKEKGSQLGDQANQAKDQAGQKVCPFQREGYVSMW